MWRMRQRAGWTVLAIAGASVVVLAGAGWACTVWSSVVIEQRSAPPGSEIAVTGRTFGDGVTSIHLDSPDGAIVGTASTSNFDLSVRVPDAEPGIHYLVAVGHDKQGTVVGQASAALEITSAPTAASVATEVPAPEPGPESPPEVAATTNESDLGSDRAAPTPVPQRVAQAQPVRPRTGAVAEAATAVTVPPVAEPVPAGELAPVVAAETVSSRAAVDDLWSGFAEAGRASLLDRPGDGGAERRAGGSSVSVGLILLVVAMATVGTAAVGMARRPAHAEAQQPELQ